MLTVPTSHLWSICFPETKNKNKKQQLKNSENHIIILWFDEAKWWQIEVHVVNIQGVKYTFSISTSLLRYSNHTVRMIWHLLLLLGVKYTFSISTLLLRYSHHTVRMIWHLLLLLLVKYTWSISNSLLRYSHHTFGVFYS